MRAQITLTPTESKKLIAMAVAQMEVVKQAAEEGMVVMHPSSSTFFIAEELTGEKPKTNVWVCGIIVAKAACLEMGAAYRPTPEPSQGPRTPEDFDRSWVIKGKELSTGRSLRSLFGEMGPRDVYIKGVNAVDAEGTVGVLIGNPVEGGTIGQVMAASRRKGFNVIFPVGLEKLIPIPVREAARHAQRKGLDYCMGIPCSLLPCDGITVTELKAIEILSGATAIPISAGGLGGAEGAVTLVIEGEEGQVKKAIKYAERAKGARLPQVRTAHCGDCNVTICQFPVTGKHWA